MGVFGQSWRGSIISGCGSTLRSGESVFSPTAISFFHLGLTFSFLFFPDRPDQVGAGASVPGRLEFHREPVVHRRSRSMGVHERVVRLQPRQVGTFRSPQRLADAMVHGLCGALSDLLDDDKAIDDRDRIYIPLFIGSFGQCIGLSGFDGGGMASKRVRTAEMLDHMVNLNKQFKMNDSFQLAFVHVHRPPVGTGRNKYLPGHPSSQCFKEMKQSCIQMPQKDTQLCTVVSAAATKQPMPCWERWV